MRYRTFVDPALLMSLLTPSDVVKALTSETAQKIRERVARRTVDVAFANLEGDAKSQLDSLSESTKEDLRLQLEQSLDQSRAVDDALANLKADAKSELDSLSESTKEDLRLQLLQSLDENEREIWSSVMAMQSSERLSSKLVTATWGLVAATGGLVFATIVLVIVTVVHH